MVLAMLQKNRKIFKYKSGSNTVYKEIIKLINVKCK